MAWAQCPLPLHIVNALHQTILASSFLNPEHLIEAFGTAGLVVIIFLESAFAPLPGDSLLFAAGLLASENRFGLNMWVIVPGTVIAAVIGNQAGYWFGRKAGVALYNRPDSRWFKKEHIEKTHMYFERFGPKTILLARLIPIVRGLAPIVAGVGRMEYRVFVTYNVLGGVIWAAGLITAGWFLGKQIPDVDRYLLPLVILIIIVTSIPIVFEYYRAKRHFAAEAAAKAEAASTPIGSEKDAVEGN